MRGTSSRYALKAAEYVMQQNAALLPSEKRGVYADDPTLRAEAEAVARFPWNPLTEL